MGLFSDKKEPKPKKMFVCPICGIEKEVSYKDGKIEGAAVCKDCMSQINMDHHLFKRLTLDGCKKHLEYREQNKLIYDTFQTTYRYENFEEDGNQQLWTCDGGSNPQVLRYEDILRYEYYENGQKLIYDGITKETNNEKINIQKDEITSMYILVWVDTPYNSVKRINTQLAFQKYEKCREYADCVLERLAYMFQKAMKQRYDRLQISPADEIKKYKELLDIGAISQEEYDAKKKQLLNL